LIPTSTYVLDIFRRAVFHDLLDGRAPRWTADIAGTLVEAKVGKSLVLRPR